MIKILVTILLLPALLSIAPVPRAHLETGSRAARIIPRLPSSVLQACTYEIAPARLRQQIEDPIGYPYGVVTAFSCDGDAQAVIAELSRRVAEMQAAAAAYRAAHPIGGVR